MIATLAAAVLAAAAPPAPAGPANPPPAAAPAPAAPSAAPSALQAPAPSAPPGAEPGIEAISFDEAVGRATRNATVSLVGAQEIRRAEALLDEARAGSLPLLAVNGTVTRLDANRELSGRIVSAEHQQSANATLSVPVFAPSRWYQWAHASESVDVARASARDVQRAAALTAARAYLSVVAQKRGIEVSQRAVDTARAHSEFAHARRGAGIGNALDEARADQQLATSEAQLESVRTALARAREALGVATGTDGPLDAASDPDLRAPPEAQADALRDAARDRADVQAARARASAAAHVARDGWADWLPTLLATAQPFYQYPTTITQPETGWQAQLVLSFPIFEGGLRVGQARERSALAAEANTQLAGAVLQARSEVRSAMTSLEHAEAASAQYRRAADRAGVALDLVTRAYQAGATTSLDVTDAERQARDADAAAVVAEDAVRQARLDLLAATGRFP